MLNAISKNHQQYYSKFMVKENKKENILEKENNQLHKSDVYTSAKVKTDTENMKIQKTETDTEKIEKELFYGLENKEWKEFAKKYDVEDLSCEEKKKLLTELKEKGVLNEQEFLTTSFVIIPLKDSFKEGGKITIGECEKLKLEEKNWLKNYDTLANYCDSLLDTLTEDSSNRENIQNIQDIYLKIADIFDKIAEERKSL
ncbi:hypothetical protein AAK894_14305 [Lachnospiraceae bacterium 46-61]